MAFHKCINTLLCKPKIWAMTPRGTNPPGCLRLGTRLFRWQPWWALMHLPQQHLLLPGIRLQAGPQKLCFTLGTAVPLPVVCVPPHSTAPLISLSAAPVLIWEEEGQINIDLLVFGVMLGLKGPGGRLQEGNVVSLFLDRCDGISTEGLYHFCQLLQKGVSAVRGGQGLVQHQVI